MSDSRHARITNAATILAALVLISTSVNAAEHAATQASTTPASNSAFHPPSEQEIPNNAFGKMVKRGEDLFVNTQQLRGKYVGNGLNCANCHIDRGRLANSAPMWAAWVHYPAYRGKNHMVNTMAERIQGCFRYSENGAPPPANGDVIKALETYFYWLAKGAPVGAKMKGRGYPKLSKAAEKPDFARGKQVFKAHCAICHGDNGHGTKQHGKYVFPPLWGKDSYNWGAGMHRVNTAAAFIHANMPLGKPNSLSEQQAWDVAAYVNSHERPQDPRFKGNVAQTKAKYHKHDCRYGNRVDGVTLGRKSYPNPLAHR